MDRLNGQIYAPSKERKNRRLLCERGFETCSGVGTVPWARLCRSQGSMLIPKQPGP
jgi:hypothetical protein